MIRFHGAMRPQKPARVIKDRTDPIVAICLILAVLITLATLTYKCTTP